MAWRIPAPEPKSRLGYYRLLSPNASVRVSPLCLGGMSIGDAWADMMGHSTREEAFKILDCFYEQGGNFIDTANNYQNEQSEQWIGEWMEQRKIRNEMVIATKYTVPYQIYRNREGINPNFAGNSKKAMFISVEDSLAKLKTSYIDILYVHVWDYTTKVEELMQALNILVQNGKVLYLGISDAPAWVVSKANMYARLHGLSPFIIYQGRWNLMSRDFERDIIPMCRDEGMAIAPWGAMGGGVFKSDEEIAKMEESGSNDRRGEAFGGGYAGSRAVSRALEKVAKEKGSTITGIALAYVMYKAPNVFPIIGCRKTSHLLGNVEVLKNVVLTPEDIKELEASSPIDLGFPYSFIGTEPQTSGVITPSGKFQFEAAPKGMPLNPQ